MKMTFRWYGDADPVKLEHIRQIPGIRSEASGGEGNANIAVRGIPVSTGGARYIQLQEDGLPILEFGDIIFGNADNFLRADRSVARVEAVRGGSAEDNAVALRALLDGAAGAYRDTVLLNVAAALFIAERAPTLKDGVTLAADSIDSGRARAALDRLVARSNA